MKNKKVFYGILVVVLSIVGISLFAYLNKLTTSAGPCNNNGICDAGESGVHCVSDCPPEQQADTEGQTWKTDIEDVKARHESWLMDIPSVVGVGIGECDKIPCIQVYLEKETPESKSIPKQLEGFKVDIEITGPIEAY